MRHLVLIILALCMASARAEWTVIMVNGRRHVPIEDVAAFYHMNKLASSGHGFQLVAPGRSISGQAGGHEIMINGVKYVLCFPMVDQGGRTLISAMDVTKIIEPVMRPQKIKNAAAVQTVILDAGHGGQDSGAVGPLGREKDATLDVVLRAKMLLESQGYQVRTTRSTDVFIPLEERSDFANRFTNAIFVSVHFNKSNSPGGTGIETYCLAPRGVPSMDEENLSYSDLVAHPGHAHDPENVALATAVHWAMLRNAPLYDRGIKRARFAVIKNIKIPGILVEGGFMDSPTDSRLIATAAYRQQLAQSIVQGINRYRQAVAGSPQTFEPPTASISSPPMVKPTPAPDLRRYETGATPATTQKSQTAVLQTVESIGSAESGKN